MTLVLQQGDYVPIKGISDEEYKVLGEAFINAGAKEGEFPNITWKKQFPFLGWNPDGLYHSGLPKEHFKGRQLSVKQVLENKEWKPKVGEECEYSWGGTNWTKTIPKYIGNTIMLCDTSGTEFSLHTTVFKFRQIKSEKEIAVEQLSDIVSKGGFKSALVTTIASDIYDAGWRKL